VSRTASLLALTLTFAAPAGANGIRLNWNDCAAGTGTSNKAFACNTNQQNHVLVTSFVLAAPLSRTGSVAGTIDIVAAASTLPAWWEFGGCRSGSLRVNSSFAPQDACPFGIAGCSGGGINSYVVGVAGPHTARIEFSSINCQTRELTAGVEYMGPVLVVNSTRTVGSPSCEGCDTGVCLTLTRMRVGTTLEITTPADPPNGNRVTWQGGGPNGDCQVPTSARRSLWGAVKALYR
jgi:hypothetical protein